MPRKDRPVNCARKCACELERLLTDNSHCTKTSLVVKGMHLRQRTSRFTVKMNQCACKNIYICESSGNAQYAHNRLV